MGAQESRYATNRCKPKAVVANVTTLSDIAGQLTEASHNADQVTVAGICLPSSALTQIRRRIPANFPKWRDATDEQVKYMISLMCRESLGIAAYSIDKRKPWWTKFWMDADCIHAKVSNLSGGPIGILKAGTLFKFLLFGESATLAVAHAIGSKTLPSIPARDGKLHIDHALVFDSDLQGSENIAAFADTWRVRNSNLPLTESLGIEYKTTTMLVTTEQQERLLLIPDYVAGLVQAKNSQANTLKHSHITRGAVSSSLNQLAKSGRFVELEAPAPLKYADIYPEFAHFLKPSSS